LLAGIFSYLLIVFVDKVVGANINIHVEIEGLDKYEIGETAYLMLEDV